MVHVIQTNPYYDIMIFGEKKHSRINKNVRNGSQQNI